MRRSPVSLQSKRERRWTARPGEAEWVRVIIRKKRSSAFQMPPMQESRHLGSQGLPDSADEFLGALLGVRVRTG
jgi:hypothetical protein